MAGLHTNRGAKRGREARKALGVDRAAPLPCLLTVVEDHAGLPVVVRRMPEDVAGACWRDGDHVVLHVNGAHGRARQRFTLAHELGHAWCKHDGKLAVDTVTTLSGATTNPNEIQANAFAAELLLPKAAMDELDVTEPTLEHVVRIAAAYGVSAIAVLIRFGQCDRVSDGRYDVLKAEIDERLHLRLYDDLDLPTIDDRLAAIDELPYLSPALDGSALAAALRGDVSIAAAAGAARCDRAELQTVVDSLSGRA